MLKELIERVGVRFGLVLAMTRPFDELHDLRAGKYETVGERIALAGVLDLIEGASQNCLFGMLAPVEEISEQARFRPEHHPRGEDVGFFVRDFEKLPYEVAGQQFDVGPPGEERPEVLRKARIVGQMRIDRGGS